MADHHDASSIRFLSLGMVTLDEIHLPGGNVRENILGGSCSYSTVGARLAVEGATDQVGCFVLAGDDFPFEAEEQLNSWKVSLVIQKGPDRESMRGKLQYHDDSLSNKTFGYTTSPLQPAPADLPFEFLASSSFHILAGPEQVVEQVEDLLRVREDNGIAARPLLIWEPLPTQCRPNSLAAHVEASKLVDIFSPNHLELDALCGRLQSQGDEVPTEIGREHVQSCTAAFLAAHPATGPREQLVIVRSGEYGALVATRSENAAGVDQIDMTWIDAFCTANENDQFVDSTGAGHAFLGALAIELQQNGGDAVEAAVKASVASSFVCQQVGLPVLASSSGTQTWNGVSVASRMEEYERRTRQARGSS